MSRAPVTTVDCETAASTAVTSLVVPERVNASTRSYLRPVGSSEAVNASVSPCPARSRSTAYAWATNQDVPQPTTATRSPRAGRTPAWVGASSAARAQHSGWVAISASV